MNMPIHFNTLDYARKLGDAGVPSDQAEAQAQALAEVLHDATVTPADLLLLKTDLLARIDILRNDIHHSMHTLDARIDRIEQGQRLLFWLAGIAVLLNALTLSGIATLALLART